MRRLAHALGKESARNAVLVALGLMASHAYAQAPGAAAAAPPAVPAGGPQDPGSAAPPQPPPPVEPAPWQGRLDELDRRTRSLEEAATKFKTPPVTTGELPVFQVGDNGFAIGSNDGRYQIRFRGLFQIDGRAFFGEDSPKDSINNPDTFQIRKARPIFAGTVLGLTDFFVSPDFANFVLYDAFLDTHPRPWLRLRTGLFKQPWGLERLQADQDLTFIERALDQWLTEGREVGVQLWGDVAGGIVRYEVGIYNGYANGAQGVIDNNEAKTYGGRIFLQPFNTPALKALGRLGVGIAGATGKERGVTGNPWLGSFRSAGQQVIFSYLPDVYALGRHSRINPQLYYYYKSFGLLAEWVKERQEIARGTAPSVVTGAVKNSSGHVTVSYALGGDVTYEGVKPRHPVDLAQGYWGALELGVRYNWLITDDAAFPTAANPATSVKKAQGVGVALNWQLSRQLKASVNYEQTWFEGGAGTIAAPTDKATEKVLIGRYQVAF